MCASTQHLQLVENLSSSDYGRYKIPSPIITATIKVTLDAKAANRFSLARPLGGNIFKKPNINGGLAYAINVSYNSYLQAAFQTKNLELGACDMRCECHKGRTLSESIIHMLYITSSDNADIAVDVGTSVSAYTNVCLLKLFTLLKCSAAHTSRRIDWSHGCYEN
uniref:Uncharacterized protein n=1 Tax=Glossina austeni TaxID=7395 RepID=A0A1A9VAK5_GLOAU